MTRRLPPLISLRAFEAAARHGSFVRAGAELALTPAAISHHVKLLEAHLQVALFTRLARGLRLTEAGRACLPGLSSGFDALEHAITGIRAERLAGPLVISVLPSFAAGWLIERLPRFRTRHPEIDLHVRADVAIVDLDRDGVDLAVRYGTGRFPGLRAVELLREEVFPVCAPGLVGGVRPPRRFADLRRYTLLHDSGARRNEPWINWGPWLRESGLEDIDLARGLHFTDSAILYQAAIAGHGIAIGRSVLVGGHLSAGRLVKPLGTPRVVTHAYYAVTRARVTPKVDACVRWLLEEAAL
ncbi:transcriptional regulator GcvA [Reyranella sp. CPCC 100927]|uniref:transcriptional regulator GcvA n=1 Tax=Reyranella sp. CPCC 100927 TaxID=2599616 RepID=UPI0011B5A0AB|nr:transcriptional regulator GcvA [Reyranella sp. CPCC 100927]TWT01239.1 transcriptional regulator GcvA [Reyranella sp. CPCC 100927]